MSNRSLGARALQGVRTRLRAVAGERGMATAEYAVGLVAAVAFALLLVTIIKSDAVRGALSAIVTGALQVG